MLELPATQYLTAVWRYHLSPGERRFLEYTAWQRNDFHMRNGYQNYQYDVGHDQTGYTVHLWGVIGEYVVHVLFQVPYRPNPRLVSNKYDILLPSGRKGEIKYRRRQWYEFAIDERDEHHLDTWDVGILVLPTVDEDIESDPVVVLSIPHSRFKDKMQVRDLRRGGNVYLVEHRDMDPIELLIAEERPYMKGAHPFPGFGTEVKPC